MVTTPEAHAKKRKPIKRFFMKVMTLSPSLTATTNIRSRYQAKRYSKMGRRLSVKATILWEVH